MEQKQNNKIEAIRELVMESMEAYRMIDLVDELKPKEVDALYEMMEFKRRQHVPRAYIRCRVVCDIEVMTSRRKNADLHCAQWMDLYENPVPESKL